jgi:ATP-dependent Clp protease ATP-binding subunit ClpA
MFERFGDAARRAVVLAQEEAEALGHDYLGTEHLLLGLLAEGEGRAADVLARAGVTRDSVLEHLRGRDMPLSGRVDADALAAIGIDLDEVRRRVEDAFGPGALLRTRTGCRAFARRFTPRAKRVLEVAWQEARKHGEDLADTEHLLLGLLEEGDGVAAKILGDYGVTARR